MNKKYLLFAFLQTLCALLCAPLFGFVFTRDTFSITAPALPEEKLDLHIISGANYKLESPTFYACVTSNTKEDRGLFEPYYYAESHAETDTKEHSHVNLHKVYVVPRLRRQGIGKMIFEKLLEEIKAGGYKTISANFSRQIININNYGYTPENKLLMEKLIKRGFKIKSKPKDYTVELWYAFDGNLKEKVNTKQIIPLSTADEDSLPTKKTFW